MLNMGALNYLLGLPLMFFALAAARRFLARGEARWGVVVAALLMSTFLAHLMTCAMTTAFVVALSCLHVRRRRDLLLLWPIAGVVGIVALWLCRTSESVQHGEHGLGIVYDSMWVRISTLHHYALRFFRDDPMDEIVSVLLIGAWVVALAAGAEDQGSREKPPISEWMRRHDVELLTGCAVAGWLVLPAHIAEVHVINHRVIIVIAIFVALWPAGQRDEKAPARSTSGWRSWARRLAGVFLVGVASCYPLYAAHIFARFEDEVLGGLPDAIAELPEGAFLGYASDMRNNHLTYMGPTWHIPAGVHAVHNGGVTDDSFAWRPTTAIQYLDPVLVPPRPSASFWRDAHLSRMDFALWRGNEPRSPTLARRTQLIFHESDWWLFRVRPVAEWPSGGIAVGSVAEQILETTCGGGVAPRGARVHVAGALVSGVQLTCMDSTMTPIVGTASSVHTDIVCAEGQTLRGFHGRAGDLIDALGPVCSASGGAPHGLDSVGGSGGRDFALFCPHGALTALAGEAARFGLLGLQWGCEDSR
jgi:hypothetical protein